MTGPVCSECGEPLDDSRPWQLAWSGPCDKSADGIHIDCLETLRPDEEEEEDR